MSEVEDTDQLYKTTYVIQMSLISVIPLGLVRRINTVNTASHNIPIKALLNVETKSDCVIGQNKV